MCELILAHALVFVGGSRLLSMGRDDWLPLEHTGVHWKLPSAAELRIRECNAFIHSQILPQLSVMVFYPMRDSGLDSNSSSELQCVSSKFCEIQSNFEEQKLFMLLRVCKIRYFSCCIFSFKKTAEVAFLTFQESKAHPLCVSV